MTTSFATISITSSHLVLVEGRDEINLVGKMIDEWSIHGLQVLSVGGKDNFRAVMELLVEVVERDRVRLSAIGILRDADDYPARAFQSAADALRSQGFQAPSSHGIIAHGPPSIGIFILPNGVNPGAIEDLCWEAVRDTPAAQCSAAYLECLQQSHALRSTNPRKTLVHTYLAAQEDPSTTVGIGAQRGYWPLHHPAFDPLRDFLHQLATI